MSKGRLEEAWAKDGSDAVTKVLPQLPNCMLVNPPVHRLSIAETRLKDVPVWFGGSSCRSFSGSPLSGSGGSQRGCGISVENRRQLQRSAQES